VEGWVPWAPCSWTASSAVRGRRSEPDPDDRNIFLQYVNPGVTDQGQAVFTMAPDPRGFKLALGEADLLSDELGTVLLGF
jgi:hypothetical protein